jgi:hypothetical protein
MDSHLRENDGIEPNFRCSVMRFSYISYYCNSCSCPSFHYCPAEMLEHIDTMRTGQSRVHNLLILTSVIVTKKGIQDF